MLKSKENSDGQHSDAAGSTSSDSWEWLNVCSPGLFLAAEILCPCDFLFLKAVPLQWFSDVPDAPENLVLSDRKGRNVTLKWVPGDDHNSSTTGKKEHPCVQVSGHTAQRGSVHLVANAINMTDTFLSSILHVNRFVWYHLVQYESIIGSSKHESWLVSLRNVQAQSRVWGVFCTAGG